MVMQACKPVPIMQTTDIMFRILSYSLNKFNNIQVPLSIKFKRNILIFRVQHG